MPDLKSILETALYVDDMDRATTFYEDVMQLPSLMTSERLCAFNVNDANVLLLFIRGGTLEPVDTGHGIIPPHNGVGQLHVAFSCTHDMLPAWQDHLQAKGVEIEGETSWKRGGRSIYFRDPDGNLLEIATSPGLWSGF
jgi:catechol 2,3-dioxygenase-like lactoylglutathione lyase family enzyme